MNIYIHPEMPSQAAHLLAWDMRGKLITEPKRGTRYGYVTHIRGNHENAQAKNDIHPSNLPSAA